MFKKENICKLIMLTNQRGPGKNNCNVLCFSSHWNEKGWLCEIKCRLVIFW